MKITIDRKAFADALKSANAILPVRTPKPILCCVHLEAIDGRLWIRATDLDIGITQAVDAVEVKEDGVAVVPAAILAQIVNGSPDATIAIESENAQTTIVSSDGKFTLHSYPAADYPAQSVDANDADFHVEAGPFAEAINQTVYAVATENSRYAINGVLVNQAGKALELVATDGHRLAMSTLQAQKADSKQSSAIVPTRAMRNFARLFPNAETVVAVQIRDGRITFSSGDVSLSSSLVEGNFPPHKDVIPKNGPIVVTANTEALSSAVKRAAVLTNEESKGVKLSFIDNRVTITSRAPEAGEATIDCDVDGPTGTVIEIGFNPFYLLDVLKTIRVEDVTITLAAANKPGVFTVPGMTAVVMPVNLT